jgi:hypothetical protein
MQKGCRLEACPSRRWPTVWMACRLDRRDCLPGAILGRPLRRSASVHVQFQADNCHPPDQSDATSTPPSPAPKAGATDYSSPFAGLGTSRSPAHNGLLPRAEIGLHPRIGVGPEWMAPAPSPAGEPAEGAHEGGFRRDYVSPKDLKVPIVVAGGGGV